MRIAHDGLCQQRYPVHRYQIHRIHHEYPDEYSQRQRAHHVIAGVEAVFDAFLHHLNNHLNDVLPALALWCLNSHASDNKFKEADKQHTQKHRHQHGVDINRPEAHFCSFLWGVCKRPVPIDLAKRKIGQVMGNVFCCGLGGFRVSG